MDRAIDRCAGALQDASHAKWLVFMAGEADVAGAVADDDLVAESIAELGCDLGTEHVVIEVGEALTLGEY